MKKKRVSMKNCCNVFAGLMLIIATVTSYSGSLFLVGEPKPPKSLIR